MGAKPHILIVDDSADVTGALRVLFEETGNDVSVANTIRDAVAAADGYTDNCGGAVTAELTGTTISGSSCSWTVTYTFSVEDVCGNTLPGQTIIHSGSDQTAPTGATTVTGTTGINACYVDANTAPAGTPAFDAVAAADGGDVVN